MFSAFLCDFFLLVLVVFGGHTVVFVINANLSLHYQCFELFSGLPERQTPHQT